MRFKEIAEAEFQKDYYRRLHDFVENEYEHKTIFPPKQNIFRALNLCDYEDVKVVILGQDPYHELHQANGLAFSVYPGVRIPPSLVNIYKELHNDLGMKIPNHGDLTKWAKQGVLLLNNVLTVEQGRANSHAGKGWEIFTLNIVKALNEREKPLVFILWGNNARAKKQYIDTSRHLVLESAHPSPLSASRGFFGSRPFSKANQFLKEHGIAPIDWQIEDI
ncbi:uracil-DNA glycosylase [uncultured Thomasclavelia sp.]|uniref:uracil-DNA glycosylase n=1 Tax=uncultured Thomasclavelia sp. TaxID=3025759 RepID=UPI0025FB5A2E|nr:uracil-DNA glycosylase [uncultured Thomasclavelia sp.]